MIEMFKLLLSLSVSASVVALLLFLCKPLYRDRLSKTWQYYIWLVVVVRLLVPFAPEQNLIAFAADRVQAGSAAADTQSARSDSAISPLTAETAEAAANAPLQAERAQRIRDESVNAAEQSAAQTTGMLKDLFMRNLLVIWFVPAAVLFMRKLTSYHSFVRYIRAGREEVDDEQVLDAYRLACADVGVGRPLPIYRNELAVSPMLVGVLRPCIVLPALEIDSEELRLVLRHELTHYKRRDILYKWLVQIAVCVHWFNPVVYFVSREVGKNCELSCDEAVITRLPDEDKRQYGETLLATVKTGGVYNDAVASVTLSEDGKQLKERLHAILRYRPGSAATKAIALVVSLCVLCGAAYLGAYRGLHGAAMTASAGGTAVQNASVPVILAQDEYRYLTSAAANSTQTMSYQNGSAHTALYIAQEGAGSFDLTVYDSAGRVVLQKSGVSFTDGADPVVVFSSSGGTCSLELRVPADGPASVAVYGAGLTRMGSYANIRLPALPELPRTITNDVVGGITNDIVGGITNEIVGGIVGGIAEGIAQDIVGNTLDGILGSVDNWEQWANEWEQWAYEMEDYWEGWENSFTGNESWRYLNYLYEDGYLVGVGSRNGDSLDNYSQTITVSVGGQSYTVAFDDNVKAYAGNAKVGDLIVRIIGKMERNASRSRLADLPFLSVRSITYNPDAASLLRDSYASRAFVEFAAMVEHCAGNPVIEELLYKAMDDEQSLYFHLLADVLPNSFQGAEALARQAVEKGDIIMLSSMERFLTSSLYDQLMSDLLGLDRFPFK